MTFKLYNTYKSRYNCRIYCGQQQVYHPMTLTSHRSYVLQSWFLFGLGALFFATEYFARVAPAVMVPELMQSFHVDALAIGTLSAFFYYPYIIMQVPAGLIYDTLGIQKVLGGMILLCTLGAGLFVVAHTFWLLIIARILIGFSSAFAFTGALKIAAVRFPPHKLGLLAGITQGMGMFGAALSEEIFGFAMHAVGWRSVMLIITLVLFINAVLIFIFLHDKQLCYTKTSSSPVIHKGKRALITVLSNKDGWINAVYAALGFAPTGAFAALWGIPYLQKNYQLPLHQAAAIISMIFLAWGITGPVVGHLSDKMKKRKPLMLAASASGVISLSSLIYLSNVPLFGLYVLAFIYGASNCGVSLAYAIATEINPLEASGVSIAFTNMLSIITTPFLQLIIGALLVFDYHHTQHSIHAPMTYSMHNYHYALFALPLITLLSFFLVFFIKETHCQRVT